MGDGTPTRMGVVNLQLPYLAVAALTLLLCSGAGAGATVIFIAIVVGVYSLVELASGRPLWQIPENTHE